MKKGDGMVNGKHMLKPAGPGRVAFKVGSSILAQNGSFNEDNLDGICRGVHGTMGTGPDVYLCTSGGGLAGFLSEGIDRKAYKLQFMGPDGRTFRNAQAENDYYAEVQRLAAAGWPRIVNKYRVHFEDYGLKVEPFAVDMRDPGRYVQQMKDCARMGIVPVINEDDSLTYEGVPYKDRDNDKMAAAVSLLLPADMLVILSKHQLHDRNPDVYDDARKIDLLYGDQITDGMIEAANGVGIYGKGGMGEKLRIGRHLTENGIEVRILGCDGCGDLYRMMTGAVDGSYGGGTLFLPPSFREQSGLETAGALSTQ